jgi:four helix bundle protein
MFGMRDPNNYTVFIKAHALALRLASITALAPIRRQPGLSQQLRRASNSVPANIAEGCAHSSQREFARFLQHALASAGEVGYHLKFAADVNAITPQEDAELRGANTEIRRMLASLLRKVRDDLTDDDDDTTVAAMQRRRTPRPPVSSAQANPVPSLETESNDRYSAK